jgi:signal peptidase I
MQENVNQNISPKKEKGSFTKGFIEQLELVVIFLAIIILVFSFVCKSCMVDGDSMLNTLHNQDRVVIWSLFYKPQYGDIVVIHDNGNLNKPIVKRVIGLPGDTVEVAHFAKGMQVTLTHSDGSIEVLEEDYIRYSLSDGHLSSYPSVKSWTVGEGEVFVMGDNRLNSADSRMEGCYDQRQILGKVIFRMTPINKMGTVK